MTIEELTEALARAHGEIRMLRNDVNFLAARLGKIEEDKRKEGAMVRVPIRRAMNVRS